VHHPQVLGDTYEELVESLARLADADLVESKYSAELQLRCGTWFA